MSPLRLALVTRRFWPLVGGAEIAMANLATGFLDMGHRPQIVTALWERDWPSEFVHREVPVHRLPNPPQRGWGTLRYMMALSRWLREHQGELDAVYVSMLKHDAYAAIGALRATRIPVVLRVEGGGETGDCHWHETARFGMRIRRRCQQSDSIIAPSESLRDELLAAGFPTSRISVIVNGVAIPMPRDGASRSEARIALAEVNPDLGVHDLAPVVLFTGRLHAGKGLHDLIRAWPVVLQSHPEARLWLIGEGPERDALFEMIVDAGLRGQVLMPGAFDDVQDLLAAADLFVLPSYQEGLSIALLEAMAAGVPTVASDIPGNRALIRHGVDGLLCPAGNPSLLAATIVDALTDRVPARTRAAEARRRAVSEFSLERSAREHLVLFETLCRQRAQTPFACP
ncbi:MAG: glycosyltransferase family 4 protein [Planctomycetes bacterium]|nr:glycosyltransferase family 4 protein [Planctomycetota bacterium]